jgi:hypothetical protein
MPHTWVVVPEIRNCDMCHQDPPVPAYADGKTTFGPWANMCKPCFEIYGVGLGLGMGQELLLEPPGTTEDEDLDTDDCGVPKDVTVGLWEGLPVILEEEGE